MTDGRATEKFGNENNSALLYYTSLWQHSLPKNKQIKLKSEHKSSWTSIMLHQRKHPISCYLFWKPENEQVLPGRSWTNICIIMSQPG